MLYRTMYEHRKGRILWLDDCDSDLHEPCKCLGFSGLLFGDKANES